MSTAMLGLLLDAFWQTLAMVAASSVMAALVGVPMGVVLVITTPGHILPRPALHGALGAAVNAGRSTPFIILLVAIIPFTRLVVGTSIGTSAAIVPLSVAAVPFVARLAEAALREVDPGLVEAAQAMGASPRQIVLEVLVPEALPGLTAALTITVVNLISYSAMAGAVGGGGLGDLGIRYGYQRFQPVVMLAVVVILIVLVEGVQALGDRLARRLDHRLARARAG
jgi:D-methionine transport system permease protein